VAATLRAIVLFAYERVQAVVSIIIPPLWQAKYQRRKNEEINQQILTKKNSTNSKGDNVVDVVGYSGS